MRPPSSCERRRSASDVALRAPGRESRGIDRLALGLTGNRTLVADLLLKRDFKPGYRGEVFRFVRAVDEGKFVVDLLVAPGASRAQPPIIERGLPTLAAPGLAYALLRGPEPLELTLRGQEQHTFELRTVRLGAAFVLKAALVTSGARTRPDRVITDTVDAVMLASACSSDAEALGALASARRRSDVRSATGWIERQFSSKRSTAARRVSRHFHDAAAAEWAVDVAHNFAAALDEAKKRAT